MGYSNRLYFVNKIPKRLTSQGFENPNYHWAPLVAMCEVERCHELHRFFIDHSVPTNRYIYADDGNTEIIEDNCGEPLGEVSIDALCEWIDKVEADPNINTEFREFAIMKGIAKTFQQVNVLYNERIVVLHYGH